MRKIRVFPRKTSATPDDDMVRFDTPTFFDEADEVDVSVAFTWDIPVAERLAEAWMSVTDRVRVGGVAYGDRGDEFTPGLYLKHGHVITSRGCPNKCWFCDVHKREGGIRELKIHDGYILQDSNILATSIEHQVAVFEMLERQKERPRFNGGLEAALLTEWHCEWLKRLKPKTMWFAYDTPNDYEPLVLAGRMLAEYGVISCDNAKCYVLIGYKGDTIDKAEIRLNQTIDAGFMPQAMLYNRLDDKNWRRFQREWANRWIVATKINIRKHGKA